MSIQQSKIEEFVSQLYLDVQGPPGTKSVTEGISEDYVVKVVTRAVVSICSAYFSIAEIFDYLRNRRIVREFGNEPLS